MPLLGREAVPPSRLGKILWILYKAPATGALYVRVSKLHLRFSVALLSGGAERLNILGFCLVRA